MDPETMEDLLWNYGKINNIECLFVEHKSEDDQYK